MSDGRTEDRRWTPSDDKSSHGLWPGELENQSNWTNYIQMFPEAYTGSSGIPLKLNH